MKMHGEDLGVISLVQKRYEDEINSEEEEETVSSWEDLLEEENEVEKVGDDVKGEKEVDLLEPTVFGENVERSLIGKELEESIEVVTKAITEAKKSGDNALIEQIVEKIVIGACYQKNVEKQKKILEIFLEDMPKSAEKEDKKQNNQKVQKATTTVNATTVTSETKAKPTTKNAAKKSNLNFGSSKKKFNKKWDTEEIYAVSDDYSD